MKKHIALSLCFTIIALSAVAREHRYQGKVLECISGNCVNGEGVASMTMNSKYEDDRRNILHYTGHFKNGLMDGEGTFYKTASDYYVSGEKKSIFFAHFEENELEGHCIEFKGKYKGEILVPDSSEAVNFQHYDGGALTEQLRVGIDGTLTAYTFGKHNKEVAPDKLSDEWLVTQATAYIASRKDKFAPAGTPTATPVLLVRKTFTVQRGKSVTFCDYTCLTDRKYFVTAGSRAKNYQMPFGGSVIYQVQTDDNKVVFEAAADTYWTPKTPGHYTFVILYDQQQAYGNGNYLVDLLKVECTLQSRSLF